MSLERIRALVARFRERISAEAAPAEAKSDADSALLKELLESMLLARHLDLAAHELKAGGHGHYTICSSGHEANVVLGRLTVPSDPSLLHYRSAALQIERARHVPDVDAVRDIALSLVASSEEPISGGRHKVFGNAKLGIIPQTSTIASHLPRAVGLAFGLERLPRIAVETSAAKDAIAMVSFGDASINHSTALGAFNAAGFIVHQRLNLPLLFVCEDNGLGISVRTPEGWVETRLRALPHIAYFVADGSSLIGSLEAARAAVVHCRTTRRPAVLHLRCVRLLGHAGSDVDTSYRSPQEIAAAEGRDPVLCAARELIAAGVASVEQVLGLENAAAERVAAEARRAIERPKLVTREAIVSDLVPAVGPELDVEARRSTKPLAERPATLAQGINLVLGEALERYPELLIFGEDVAKKGGVYGVTKGLLARAGPARVFNTLLDEQTILGLALGTATLGALPVPEIQYLAYLHNAEDQLRGEAATMQFFSRGAYRNPMLVRIAGLPYQKGFGGHFHNDNSLAVLRDIPGLVVAVPARADDAVELYRTGLALAKRHGRVVVVIEPIALYYTRDLFEAGDQAWLAAAGEASAEWLRARVYQPDAADLAIVTYGNGVFMSLRAARRLERETKRRARVLDLRWLSPLPLQDVVTHAREVGRVLVVDECRRSAGISEAIGAAILDAGIDARFARVTSADSFIPLGAAADLVLVSESEIFEAAVSASAR